MASSNEKLIPLDVRERAIQSVVLPSVETKTWTERTFGKMKAGSVRGSIFTLASTAMGAGYLATPNILVHAGVILGLGILVFCAFLIY